MKEKFIVRISKIFGNPQIKIRVFKAGLDIDLDLKAYERACLEKIGSPAFIMTKGSLAEKWERASLEVIKEMKAATVAER